MGRSTNASSPSHENNFNFLRLFFACLVLVAHAPELVDGDRSREPLSAVFHNPNWSLGSLAVTGFFLISGYLILQSWLRTPRPLDYLNKRVRRIVPGFWFATLVCGLVVDPLGSHAATYFAQFPVKWFIVGALFLCEPILPAVFVGQPQPHVNGSMWTIQYEFACYLLIVVLGLLGVAKRRMLYLGVAIGVLVLAACQEQYQLALPGQRFAFLLPMDFHRLTNLASFFCAGGCFYLFQERIHYTRSRAAICLVLVVVALSIPAITREVMATAGAYLLFTVAFAKIRPLAWFNSLPDISYGVYLYGWPTQKLIHWYWPSLSPWTLLALTLPVVAMCGWLSWHLVEKRFTVRKKKPALSPAPQPVAVETV